MPDEIFANPRLAAIYDAVDHDRSDLDPYVAIVGEFGAQSVLDVGCGTGTLACRLAARGVDVVGVDPAQASLDVARSKPHAERVRWVAGDVFSLPPLRVDLALMTGNVAQVFLSDADWAAVLAKIERSVHGEGRFVFETRDPARRAWEEWTEANTRRRIFVDGVGRVEAWTELVDVALATVSFRHTYRFESDGVEIVSDSTLRFRDLDEIESSLDETGWAVDEIRDAPDRPGLEFVVVASKRARP